jgi:diguanylate cyclase (GGDEF)-like protein
MTDLLAQRSDGGNERLLFREAASLLAADLSLGELFERLTMMLPAYLDSSVVFIALAHDDGRHAIEYIYDHGEIRRYPHIQLSDRSRARAVMTTGEIIWGNHPSIWAPEGTAPINRDRPWTNDTLSAIFVPMRAGGAMVGCLSVQSVHQDAYNEDDVDTIAAIGHYLAVAVQNQRMYQALQRTADYDALTSLSNHSRIVRELDDAVMSGEPLAVVMLDTVNFARFNETYGYAAGDEVLRQIARTLRRLESAIDDTIAGRFGADVFLMVLRSSDAARTESSIAKLRSALDDLAFVANDQTLPITVACGYACASAEARTGVELIALCEDRTRRSRKAGGVPVGDRGGDSYTIHGDFGGIAQILDTLLERDPFTRVHLLHVNALAAGWAPHLPLDDSQRQTFLRASLLHDVGKLLVSDRTLNKPGRLTPEEYEAVMLHAEHGRHILMQHPGFEEVARVVGEHHERWDGEGYPSGLSGNDIHPLARAISILDAYSAMVADRPYHRAITPNAALAELQRCAGTQVDPGLVERFIAWCEDGSPPTPYDERGRS